MTEEDKERERKRKRGSEGGGKEIYTERVN